MMKRPCGCACVLPSPTSAHAPLYVCCRDAPTVKRQQPQEDWALCMNGTRHDGAVKGAVGDFISQHGLTVAVCYGENAIYRTWMIRKPGCS